MTNYEIDVIINKLLEEGFDLNTINQVNKCLNNGFEEMKNIGIHVTADQIRQISEAYNSFYKNEYGEKDLKHVQCLFVEALNERLPLQNLTNRWHQLSTLTMIIEDLKEGINVEHYLPPSGQQNYGTDKMNSLRRLSKENFFDGLTAEQINAIKTINFKFNDISILLNVKQEGLIDDFIKYYKSRIDVPGAHIMAKFKNAHPDWVKVVENKNAEYIAKFDLLLKEEENIEKLNKIKGFLKTLNIVEVETLLKYEITEDVIDILKMKFDSHVTMDIIENPDKYNMQLVKLFNEYEYGISTYDFKYLKKIMEELPEEKVLEALRQELENNDVATIKDFVEIIEGIKSGIDISRYITDSEQDYAYDYVSKRYIRFILEYNKKHEDCPIDLELIFDDYDRGEDIINNDNIEELISLLEKDIDITPFIEADPDTIDTLSYNYEKYNLNPEQLKLLVSYEKFEPSEDNLEFLMQLVGDGYKILNQEDIFRSGVSIYKKLSKLAEYDEFSKKILDEKLTEDNCEVLINCLIQYQKATGIFKDICKYNLSHDNLFVLNENMGQNMSTEKLDIIYQDLIEGINPSKYASDNFSLEQLKIFSEINRYVHNMEDDFRKTDVTRELNQIYNPNFSIEQLQYIKNQIMTRHKMGKYKPEYSVRQMKLYDNWTDVSYIYNFSLYNRAEKANDMICSAIRKAYGKLDKSTPIEEQEKLFKNIQKETLTSIAESEELDLDMDTKILIYKIVENLDEKAKEQENIAR